MRGVIMHHDKRRHKQCRKKCFSLENIFPKFFSELFRVIGLRVQDELEPMPPLRPGCEEIVMDLVGWSRGAKNVEK